MKKIEVKYTVDKGVPVPVRPEALPLDNLEIGESIRFPIEQRNNVQSQASKLKANKGKVFTVQYDRDEGDCRVWRTA